MNARLQPRADRPGFTIIELVVSLAVIGILMSLILPAVQSSRESRAARKAQCQNNLRQFMQACTAHEAALGRYPPTVIGLGTSGQLRDLSPHFYILPYIEQVALYNSIDQTEDGMGAGDEPPASAKNPAALTTRVPVFECPSDSIPAGGTSYRACTGTGPSLSQTIPQDDGAAKGGAFSYGGVLPARFRDGLGRTIFFSEKLVGDQDDGHFTPWRDYFISGGSLIYPADAERACQLPAGVTDPVHGSFGGSAWLFSGYASTWYNHIFTPEFTKT